VLEIRLPHRLYYVRLPFMTQKQKTYENLSVKKLDKSRVEISASIPVEMWEKFRSQALKNINESVTMDGFRKGMVPENVLVGKVGEMPILEEMAELALSKAYVDIIVDGAIDAIGKPRVELTKLAKGNPLEFKATLSVIPEVKLPEYKKLAAEEVKKSSPDEEEVTDKDVDDAILKIRKSRVSHEGHDHDNLTPEEHDKMVEENLPEFNDEFVKTLGKFENIEDFKIKIRELLAEEKKDAAREKRRIRIADAIEGGATIDLPEIMIESELDRMQAQFEADIGRMNVKLEDYLKHAKKSVEEIRNEWRSHAEKKAKLQLVLNEIAKKEKIEPSAEEVEKEVDHIDEHYKEADRERATVYAVTVLTNEKVFEWLENQK
jgi:FKBP-type peptidyl-prolyl cis-trans isomerase (trigger factor)